MRDEDEGEYLCKAFNAAGETTTSAFLLHPGLPQQLSARTRYIVICTGLAMQRTLACGCKLVREMCVIFDVR